MAAKNGNTDPAIPEKFLKPYNPQENEANIYEMWEKSGYFNPDVCIKAGVTEKNAEHFSIVLPPPNVTGHLHLGHASMLAIEDILVRYNRMQGKKTLWVPGTDHAAIATQSKAEKEILKKEKKSRHDLGRQEFLKRVEQYAQESHDTIIGQVRAMGSSLDWSREAYTLDEQRTHAVYTAFKSMYDAGLLYRKDRIVNWDPKGQTTISDDEIVYEERDAKLYTFRYWADFPIAIATTRPETKVGDTAVAVHPDDTRYKKYVGKEFSGEFAGVTLTIRVVGDEHIDPEFGTGALGVTPAHSYADWEIADRHDLPRPQVINEYAKMTKDAGDVLVGMKVTEARAKVVDWLQENNLLENEEDIKQNVSTAERTGGIVEPLPKLQWWVDTEKKFTLEHSSIEGLSAGTATTLKHLMKHVVETDQIQFLPPRFRDDYFRWVDNLRPWCISRQIWYGHRIPVWYKGDDIKVQGDSPGDGWEQDPDTLDTWFSSGLWTFSTLGWPEQTPDLKTYHPTTVLETGYDILFFWVARMILMSGFHLGSIPFQYVYLHGLVRDEKGQKMSKSLGNVYDPMDMIGKYGADATRFALISGAAVGNDLNFSEDRTKGCKHFGNKMWNITRFILENRHAGEVQRLPDKCAGYLDELQHVTAEVTKLMEEFRLHLASEKLYHYIWHRVADEILEESKEVFASNDDAAKAAMSSTLYTILTTSLKMLHPFMPFVTETIWQELPEKDTDILMVAPWPAH